MSSPTPQRPQRSLCPGLLCAESVAVSAGATTTLPWTQNRSPKAGKTDDRSSLYLCSPRIPLNREVGPSFRFPASAVWNQNKGTHDLWPWGGLSADHGLPGSREGPHLVCKSRSQPTKLHLLWCWWCWGRIGKWATEVPWVHRGSLGPRWVCGRGFACCCLIFQEMQFEGTFPFSPNFTAAEAYLKSNSQIQAAGTASPQMEA